MSPPNVTTATPVRITAAVCETERNQSFEVGEPIVLRCAVSDPSAGASWYKDGLKLLDLNGQAMGGAEGPVRTLSFESALPYHTGEYTCQTADGATQFHVDVKGDKLCLLWFVFF